MSEIGIGTRLWCAYRGSRECMFVVGQTRSSWILATGPGLPADHWQAIKVIKTTMRTSAKDSGGMIGDKWLTDDEKAGAEFARINRSAIKGAVDYCRDAAVLRQPATLLNVETKEPEL
jgi:hypothetical protein